jgi:hypothetical protein
LISAVLLACSSEGPTPLAGYRLVGDRMLHLRAVTNPNFSTLVESVEETPGNVVISVVTRAGGFEAGSTEEFWIAVQLDAPLGNRIVLNANGNTPIGRLP